MDIISNVPATLEWRIYKGDTSTMTIVVQDDQGNDIDVTDYDFLGQIRQDPTDADELQDLAITADGNVISVTVSNTATLPRMSYFDIQTTKPDTTVSTILKGYIYTEDDISR
jgi:hypothetical protein